MFSSKSLLSLKTCSVSSLNTKYEPLTPKTERVSLDFHPKIMKNDHFSMKKWSILGIFEISRFRGQKIIFDKKSICVQKQTQFLVSMPNMNAREQKLRELAQKNGPDFLTIFSFVFFSKNDQNPGSEPPSMARSLLSKLNQNWTLTRAFLTSWILVKKYRTTNFELNK